MNSPCPQITDGCAVLCISSLKCQPFPACPLWWPCVSVLSVHHCFLSFGVFDLSPVFVVINITGMNILFKLFFPLCLFAWGVLPRVELQSQRLGTLIKLVCISRFFHKAFWQCKSILLFLIAPSQEVIDRLIPYFTVSHLYRLCLTSEQCQFSGTEHDNNVGLSPPPQLSHMFLCGAWVCSPVHSDPRARLIEETLLSIAASWGLLSGGHSRKGSVKTLYSFGWVIHATWFSRCPWVLLLLSAPAQYPPDGNANRWVVRQCGFG